MTILTLFLKRQLFVPTNLNQLFLEYIFVFGLVKNKFSILRLIPQNITFY